MVDQRQIAAHFQVLSDFEQKLFASAINNISQADSTLRSALYKHPFDSEGALKVINEVVDDLQKNLFTDWFNSFRRNLNSRLNQVITDDIEILIHVINRIRMKMQNLPSPNPNST